MKRAFCKLRSTLKEQSVKQSTTHEMANLINNFTEWKFHHPPSYSQLPINDNPAYNEPVAVKNSIFSKVPTEPLIGNISLVCSSDSVLKKILDLEPNVAKTAEFIDFVTGKKLPQGGLSVSHRYGGYQFGYWADQLGDGRAHILGEYVNSKGESWQLQLKGSGETPYSRFGDGRAVLRSSIREMIGSEACYCLRIPTSRAGALVVSDTPNVWRDKNYSGFAKKERGAIVLRLAEAWYRIGSLEILYKLKENELLKRFVDFVIKNHFSIYNNLPEDDKYFKWYLDVAHRNLDMVATWQGLGFTHGVLNTDNVSLLGLTIDYGPYGFIDHFNPLYIPNTSDDMGRYAYGKQLEIMLWNLDKLAEAMSPLLSDKVKKKIKEQKPSLKEYAENKVLQTYLSKLGLNEICEENKMLVNELFDLMEEKMADFTMTFRQLTDIDINQLKDQSIINTKWSLKKLNDGSGAFQKWISKYAERLNKENVSESIRKEKMSKCNPIYVPRNWMMQDAINSAEKDDFEKVNFLLEVLSEPYKLNEEAEKRGYSSEPPSWAYGLKLSCSS